MKIAVQIDAEGRIASPYDSGTVRVFSNDAGEWQPLTDEAFAIDPGRGLAAVKRAVHALATRLGDCRLYLACEARGLVFTILEDELGVHTWKAQGTALAALDAVAQAEAERLAAPPPPPPPSMGCGCGGGCSGPYDGADVISVTAQDLGDGRLGLDLAKILAGNPALNSRQVLFPVLEKKTFRTLEIRCDHAPRWLDAKLSELDLRAAYDSSAQGLRILISPLQRQEPTS